MLYKQHDKSARWVQLALALLIVINSIAVMLETVPSIGRAHTTAFERFEWFSACVFFAEYAARVWVADLQGSTRLNYVFTPMALVDLAAILPSLLAMTGIDLRILRILRLIRLLKLTRHAKALYVLLESIRARLDEIMIAGIFMLALMLISSSLIYYAENEAQPEIYSSIPAAWWWSVSTLATIGYGDIYPITIFGKITTALTAIFGIGLFALPGGIIASALIEQARAGKTPPCPHCGKSSGSS